MTTESIPDPIIANWAETLEGDLIEAGMDHAEAHAYRQAFELGLTRVMSVVATKQELRLGIANLRDDLRREMELRFAEVDRRFNELAQRLDGAEADNAQRFDEAEARNAQRFDEAEAHNDRRFEELEQRIDQRSDEAKKHTDQRIAELERKIDQRFEAFEKLMDARFEDLDKRLRMLVGFVALGFTINAGLLSAIIALLAQIL